MALAGRLDRAVRPRLPAAGRNHHLTTSPRARAKESKKPADRRDRHARNQPALDLRSTNPGKDQLTVVRWFEVYRGGHTERPVHAPWPNPPERDLRPCRQGRRVLHQLLPAARPRRGGDRARYPGLAARLLREPVR